MNFLFIGWKKEGTADKVWGVIKLEDKPYGKCVRFWGRRGKKLSTMSDVANWELDDLIQKKWKDGYNKVDKTKLDEVYPEFQADLEKTAFWAAMSI